MHLKIKIKSYADILDKFFHSNLFIILIAALTLLGWTLDTDICQLIMIVLFTVMFLVSKDITPFFIFQLFFVFSSRKSVFGLEFYDWKIVFLIMLVLSLIFNIIFYKPDIKGALSINSMKRMTLSMFLLIIPMSLGGLFYPSRHIFVSITIIVFFTCLAFITAYVMGVGRKNIEDKSRILKMVIYSMFFLCIVLSLEVILSLISTGSISQIREILAKKHIYLGWGGANHVGAVIALCIPANFYYMIKKKKWGFVFVIIAFLEFAILILTRSRGALLFTSLAMPILFIYVMVKSKNRISIGITLLILVIITVTSMLIIKGAFSEVIRLLLDKGFDDSGRFKLWQQGWELFKEYPIFGAGWDYDIPLDEYGFSPLAFHSMLIQVLACAGIIGLIFYGYLYFARYSTFFKQRTLEKWIVFAGMFIFEAYGMIDPISFLPSNYFLMVYVMSLATELSMPDDCCRPLLFVRLTNKK